jgi:hypothetical protein
MAERRFRTGRTGRVAAVVVATVALVATGCSDDDRAAGTTTPATTVRAVPSVPASPEYCAAARQFASVDLATTRDPARLRDAFTVLRTALPVMRSAAPAELQAAVAELAAGYDKIGTAAETDAWAWGSMAGAVMAIGEDRAFVTAGERVDDYNRQACGVVPVGAPSPTTTAG